MSSATIKKLQFACWDVFYVTPCNIMCVSVSADDVNCINSVGSTARSSFNWSFIYLLAHAALFGRSYTPVTC